MLLGIVLIGAILIIAAFWFRAYSNNKKSQALDSLAVQFDQQQIINLEIPLASDGESYTTGRIKGRIFNHSSALESNELILNQARVAAETDLNEGETLWGQSISLVKYDGITKVELLIYSEKDLKSLALTALSEMNINKVVYFFDQVALDELLSTDNSQVYLAKISLIILSDQPIP